MRDTHVHRIYAALLGSHGSPSGLLKYFLQHIAHLRQESVKMVHSVFLCYCLELCHVLPIFKMFLGKEGDIESTQRVYLSATNESPYPTPNQEAICN